MPGIPLWLRSAKNNCQPVGISSLPYPLVAVLEFSMDRPEDLLILPSFANFDPHVGSANAISADNLDGATRDSHSIVLPTRLLGPTLTGLGADFDSDFLA